MGMTPEEGGSTAEGESGQSVPDAAQSRRRTLVNRGSIIAERVRTSSPGSVWTRLNAVDFMTSSMQFAALAVICLLPFLFLVAAITGRDARQTIVLASG
jgi:hypothetical protein